MTQSQHPARLFDSFCSSSLLGAYKSITIESISEISMSQQKYTSTNSNFIFFTSFFSSNRNQRVIIIIILLFGIQSQHPARNRFDSFRRSSNLFNAYKSITIQSISTHLNVAITNIPVQLSKFHFVLPAFFSRTETNVSSPS